MSETREWFWEGNIQDAFINHLRANNWDNIKVSNTATKERGTDIQATKLGITLLMEVKGYPSTNYSDPRRSHETKKTSPTLQATHWYSHAILKCMRLKTENPEAQVAIGIPSFKRYRDLYDETKSSLEKIDIQVWSIDENGTVEIW